MFNLLSLLILVLGFFINPSNVFAFKAETFVTFSNPVTGYEGWNNPVQTPLDLPKFIYQESTPSALPVTWLLRYDAIESSTISGYFKELISKDKNQDLGLFLTITPQLVNRLGISYPEGFSEHNANRVFLSGYQDTQRKQIIDLYMSVFFDKFGFYPKSVSAWHLDSYSLQYLAEKYSVLTAMNCDDQYSMDQYRLWGGYVGSPYFPDKNNSLIPANSLNNRVNLAMVRWAPRDFYNFYGSGTASMYSFQINDYLGLGLNHNYFQNLLKQYSQKNFNEFTHLNLGLENGYSLVQYKTEIKKVIADLSTFSDPYNLHPISLANFGNWFKARYPESSPAYFYRAKDTVGNSPEEVSWYQSPWFRIGLKSNNGKTNILDLRAYNREIYEDHYNTANPSTSLFHEIPAIIDTVKTPSSSYVLDFNLPKSILLYNKYTDFWQATLVDGDKRIVLGPDKITFVGFLPPEINSTDIKITKSLNSTTWVFKPVTPYKSNISILWLILFLTLIYLIIKKPKPPVFGLILGLTAVATLYKNSQLFSFGMGFWGPNGHDALFHLSLIEHFRQNIFSLSHPQYAGVVLKDYHFLFDYLLGLVSKITSTSPQTLYFLVFPVLACLTIVTLLNSLLNQWSFNSLQKNLAFIFVFLGGSLGFILRFFTGQNIFSGESAFWANQSVSMFLNPPFILSIILLLLFLLIYTKPITNNSVFFALSLLGGLLAQTKVYAFLLLLIALLATKKIKLFLSVLFIGGILTLFFSSFSGSPFIFQPLWFIKSMLESPDRAYWQRAAEAWQAYEANGAFLKLFLLNLFGLVVFMVGNLGVRVLGFLELTNKSISLTQKIAWFIIFSGLTIPLVITQKVNPWNTIQFMYYSIFFLGIFSGKVLGSWHGSRYSIKSLVLALVIFVSIFTSVGTLRDYLTYKSASRISYTELLALNVLRAQPRGVVLSPLYKENKFATPKPQYAYVSSAYISALTGQPEFLSDTINLDITGINYQNRANDIQKFFSTEDKKWAKDFLIDNKIKYVYETPLQHLKLNPVDLGLTIIQDSGEIKLYKQN